MNLGYSDIMGIELRKEVEKQLTLDLFFYGLDTQNLTFDWSESCIEGHHDSWLDGELENFSGIAVLSDGKDIAEGWMDFIIDEVEPKKILIFWDFLSFEKEDIKTDTGIPDHIWDKLSEKAQKIWHEYKIS